MIIIGSQDRKKTILTFSSILLGKVSHNPIIYGMEKKINQRVYWAAASSMFIYAAAANALPIALVNVSRDLSFNFTQAGLLGFITSIEQFFVLILSSFIAARFGKIRTLRTAMFILTVGLTLFAFSLNYLMALGFILFIGIGNGFLEALLTPLVTDLYPMDRGSKINMLHAFWPIGVFISVLVVGELLSRGVDWRYIFLGLALFVLAISFFYPGHRKISLPMSRADFSHMGEILSLKRFWILGFALFFSGGAESAFAYWSASFIQVHYKALPRAGALGAAVFALGMVAGRMAVSRLADRYGLKLLIFITAFTGLLVSPLFFLIKTLFLLYLFLFAMGLMIASFWPSIQAYAGQVLPVDNTVLMIFLSCFGIPGYSSAVLFMGIIGDRFGLQASFVIAPVYMIMVTLLMALEAPRKKTKLNHQPQA
jgi:fucose permease